VTAARRGLRTTKEAGDDAERPTRRHYVLRGYRVLDANVWAGGYELDLVLRRGQQLVFCEVKAKDGEGFGDPLEMVDAEKQRRLGRAAELWLAARPQLQALAVRFDVVAVRPRRVERVTLVS
jgi:putative endonuclease